MPPCCRRHFHADDARAGHELPLQYHAIVDADYALTRASKNAAGLSHDYCRSFGAGTIDGLSLPKTYRCRRRCRRHDDVIKRQRGEMNTPSPYRAQSAEHYRGDATGRADISTGPNYFAAAAGGAGRLGMISRYAMVRRLFWRPAAPILFLGRAGI